MPGYIVAELLFARFPPIVKAPLLESKVPLFEKSPPTKNVPVLTTELPLDMDKFLLFAVKLKNPALLKGAVILKLAF
ncbi:hypothetical protein P872_00225 [Rhodonellum psychrophilum GCM71 = DSM 17998]|uniref:Uncharacterized protein n=2 Tax=Cytophagaceae TaxID=89373 RepID=U5BSF7_9BACT|nr:hypothetical protein P872_00225 [Rhodonellum psychrophilum GCM71 = DSM 17998]